MIKQLFKILSSSTTGPKESPDPVKVREDDYNLSRQSISVNAQKVMQRLNSSGHESYLVGGGVRDLILGGAPKDFDIATDATPEQIKKLFRNSRIIGRRFRIVHVRFGREVIEVTTFRGSDSESQHQIESETGQLLRDNVYGDLQSDALRRDFTANALYYSMNDGVIYDFSTGLEDIEQRQLRMIGSPETRYKEDPVRLLRAIRFAAKLGFVIEANTATPIKLQAELLTHVAPARLFEEMTKLFLNGYATATYHLLLEYQLLQQLFPGTLRVIDKQPEYRNLIEQVMRNTDIRIRSNKRVTPAFIFAALLWPTFHSKLSELRTQKIAFNEAFHQAYEQTIHQQLQRIMIPKRFLTPMRQIWELQWRLPKRLGRQAYRLVEHPKFRAGYDFLLLREEAGEDLGNLGQWWTRFQDVNEDEREQMIKEITPSSGKKRRRNSSRKHSNSGSDT